MGMRNRKQEIAIILSKYKKKMGGSKPPAEKMASVTKRRQQLPGGKTIQAGDLKDTTRKRSKEEKDIRKALESEGKDTRKEYEVLTIAEAYDRLTEGQRVILAKPEQTSMLLDLMATKIEEATKAGSKVKNINLCDVSVKGTNIFCSENKGINRVNMPQLKGRTVPGGPADKLKKLDPKDPKYADEEVDMGPAFFDWMEKEHGIKYTSETISPSMLKATQREMKGGQIAQMMQKMESGKLDLSENEIPISEDNYIIDGHHTVAAKIGMDARKGDDIDKPMKVRRINASVMEILVLSTKFMHDNGIAVAKAAEGDQAKYNPEAGHKPDKIASAMTAKKKPEIPPAPVPPNPPRKFAMKLKKPLKIKGINKKAFHKFRAKYTAKA
jgi:hypothetical protein